MRLNPALLLLICSRYLSYLLILFLCSHTFAQSTVDQKFSKGLLWQIHKSGSPDSFVFGTIHLPDPRVTQLPPKVAEVFQNNVSTLCTELSFDSANMHNVAAALFLKEGKSLKLIAGENLYQKTASLLEQKGLPRNVSERLKPWAAMTLVMLPSDQRPPLDLMLYQTAIQRNQQTCGLETVAEQTAVMDNFPNKSQVLMLKEVIDNYALIPGLLEKMIQLYLSADLGGLMNIADEGISATPELRKLNKEFTETVLIARNRIMVDRMQGQLKNGRAFIAVGALHLFGEKGILSLLEQRGYQVTRVY